MSLFNKDIHSVQYQNKQLCAGDRQDIQAVEADGDWDLKAVSTGKTVRTVKARHLPPVCRSSVAAPTWYAVRCGDKHVAHDTKYRAISSGNPYSSTCTSITRPAQHQPVALPEHDFSFDVEL
jgi:ribonucleoside-diphosphate reductase alpha chain